MSRLLRTALCMCRKMHRTELCMLKNAWPVFVHTMPTPSDAVPFLPRCLCLAATSNCLLAVPTHIEGTSPTRAECVTSVENLAVWVLVRRILVATTWYALCSYTAVRWDPSDRQRSSSYMRPRTTAQPRFTMFEGHCSLRRAIEGARKDLPYLDEDS